MGAFPSRYALLVGVVALAPARSAGPATPVEVARLDCAVDVRAESVTCSSVAAAQAAVTGRAVRQPGGVWSVVLDVQNTSAAPLGLAADGTPDPAGVEAALAGVPTTTAGTGAVAVFGAEAVRAEGGLAPGERSSLPAFRFRVPSGVGAFAFPVSVRATIAPPRGWLSVTPSTITLLGTGSTSISASLRAITGARLPGVTYGTSDAGVATVDAAGAVTGVAPGSASVTVSGGTASTAVAVAVCPDLVVGGVYHTALANGQSVCVSGYSGAEYTVIPTNQSGSSLSMTITGTGIQVVTGPPSPMVPAEPRQLLIQADGTLVEGEKLASDEIHIDLLERDRRELTPLLAEGARHLVTDGTKRGGDGAARLIVPGVPTVGDVWSLNVASGCSGTRDDRTGTVRAVSDHAIVVFDDANPAFSPNYSFGNPFDPDTLANRFDRIAYPVMVAAFGEPTDLDGNSRIVLFYTRAVNELSPPASSSVTLGYVTARDLFSSDPSSCPRSNEGEIAYMLVPDPTGAVNSNVRTESYVMGATIGTAGHELQHLINASRRIYVTGTEVFETVWLNEGLSHMGEELMFYDQTGGLRSPGVPRVPLFPRQNIQLSTLTTGPDASARVAAFNTYANQNYGRFREFLRFPHAWHPFNATDDLGNRGAIWAFLRYAADRRNGDDTVLWQALVNSPTSGLPNLQSALGLASQAELLTWFRDWNVAVYADDAVGGVATTYQTTSWNFRSVYGGLGGFPLSTRPLTNGVGSTQTYVAGGTAAFARAGVAASVFGSFRLDAPSAGAPVPVSVLRTK